MPPSKFEANPMLRRGVKRASFSLFTLASSCANAYFRTYAIIDFLADRLVFLNTVTYRVNKFIRIRRDSIGELIELGGPMTGLAAVLL